MNPVICGSCQISNGISRFRFFLAQCVFMVNITTKMDLENSPSLKLTANTNTPWNDEYNLPNHYFSGARMLVLGSVIFAHIGHHECMYPKKIYKGCPFPWLQKEFLWNFSIFVCHTQRFLGGGFVMIFYFHPYLGKMNPFWQAYFSNGWVGKTHQLVDLSGI